MKHKKILRVIIIVLAIGIGLYPFTFLAPDTTEGFLKFKGEDFIPNTLWYFAFFTHISLGGIALLIGWPQFLKNFRTKNIGLHRTIGKVYIISVVLSAIAGFYIAIHATGGIIAQLGFCGMSLAWLITTVLAYTTIRKKDIEKHQQWMFRSYAVTFTGVTFRLWIPLLLLIFDTNFLVIYRIDSWISWSANLVLAELFIRRTLVKTKVALKQA